ncbi:MAG: DUF3833 domain-containing protein [Gammaproteobacteria bacterium]|nr:DUF3833 domain-containing protein [Gammaproteobacteria bacterium]
MKKYFLLLLLVLSGCSSMSIESYRDSSPRFIVEDYFVGQTRAWGIFQGRNGQVERQFTVDIIGRMEGDKLILEEDFLYADGQRDRRVWTITKRDEHNYEGHAADVIGAASGKAFGNALNWSYTMDLPYKDGTVKVKFDDWMFLQPDGVLINKAKMTKLGIYLGEVTLVFQKEEQ